MSNYRSSFQGKNPRFPLGQSPQQMSRAQKSQMQKRQSTEGFVRKEMVLDAIQKSSNGGLYLKDLVEMFNNGNRLETKKSLNKNLYELQGDGLVKRTEENPPLWQLTSGNPPLPPQSPAFTPPPPTPTTMQGFVTKEQVLEVIQNTPNGVHIRDLVSRYNNGGNPTQAKKAINTILYGLQSEGHIKRTETNPPMWFLSSADITSVVMDSSSNATPPNQDFVTKEQIMEIIQNNANGVLLKDLVTKFFNGNSLQTRKAINTILYGLQGEGRIQRTESNPPVWSVASGDVSMSRPQSSPVQQQNPATREQILEVIQNNPNGVLLRDLVNKFFHGTSLQTRKGINTILYGLQGEGRIQRTESNPPVWSVTLTSGAFSRPLPSPRDSPSSPFSPPVAAFVTKEQIMEVIQNNANGVLLKDLVTKFFNGNSLQTRKAINTILYGLQADGRIQRTESNPPVWSVASGDVSMSENVPLVQGSITKEKVVEAFQNSSNGQLQLRDLMARFSTSSNRTESRKCINTILYGLQSTGFIKRTESNPPTWYLSSLDPSLINTRSPFTSPVRGRGGSVETVMEVLRANPGGVYLKDMIDVFNVSGNRLGTKKCINNILYALQSDKVVKRSESNPPLWYITGGEEDIPMPKKISLPAAPSGDASSELKDKLANLSCAIADFLTTGTSGSSFEGIWENVSPQLEHPEEHQDDASQILSAWQGLGIAEKSVEDIWSLTQFGINVYTIPLPTLHNYVFQTVLYIFGREEENGRKGQVLKTLEYNHDQYGFTGADENGIITGLEFLRELKWISFDSGLAKYLLTVEGTVMFGRMIASGGFGQLSTLLRGSTQRGSPQQGFTDPAVTPILEILMRNQTGGKSVEELVAADGQRTTIEMHQTLYMLMMYKLVTKKRNEESAKIVWIITDSGVAYLQSPQSKVVNNLPTEREILSAVHSSLSIDPYKSCSATAIRVIANERGNVFMTMEQVTRALEILTESKVLLKVEEGDHPTWKIANPPPQVATPQKLMMQTGSRRSSIGMSPSPAAAPAEPTASVQEEMETFKPIIERLPNLHVLFEKCVTCRTNISALNEYSQANSVNITYTPLNASGPDHMKSFVCQVNFGTNSVCKGHGASKKEAKTAAAARTCQVLRAYHNTYVLKLPSTQASTDMEWANAGEPQTPVQNASYQPESRLNTSMNTSLMNTSMSSVASDASASGKNPISELYENDQAHNLSLKPSFQTVGQAQYIRFVCTFHSNGEELGSWTASNKKDAKIGAARESLKIIRTRYPSLPRTSVAMKRNSSGSPIVTANMAALTSPTNTHGDKVAHLVSCKFDELMQRSQQLITGRKIFAGFVMTRDTPGSDVAKEYTVVSMGSGNRCISGDRLNMSGTIVNDSHAEVISRRGLVRFFYQQLEVFLSEPDKSIFYRDDKKMKLRAGIEFHLYISTAPCGDGALFSHSELQSANANAEGPAGWHKPIIDNKKQGVLRTKVENGEGCTPIEGDHNVPTWDGLLRGERLRTMSCSDKIMKWNLLGLQGSLLSLIIEPVYMSSLTLGSLYHHGHLARAICCRLDRFIPLSSKKRISNRFTINHPKIGRISTGEPPREARKTKTREFSINWVIGDNTMEILDGTKGSLLVQSLQSGQTSIVSSRSLYDCFKKICSSYNVKTAGSYAQTKTQALDYCLGKKILIDEFAANGCGNWMHKPLEASQFE